MPLNPRNNSSLFNTDYVKAALQYQTGNKFVNSA